MLSFVIHVSACTWRAAATLNQGPKNWLTGKLEFDDFSAYIAAVYWAITTCATVGYGDIVPRTGYELVWAMIILVFGVAVFSFVLGNLAS